MAVITLEQLEEAGACRRQRVRFQKLFGDSVVVTEETAEQYADKFDWNWAALYLPLRNSVREYLREQTEATDKYCKERKEALQLRLSLLAVLEEKLSAGSDVAWKKFNAVNVPAKKRADDAKDELENSGLGREESIEEWKKINNAYSNEIAEAQIELNEALASLEKEFSLDANPIVDGIDKKISDIATEFKIAKARAFARAYMKDYYTD